MPESLFRRFLTLSHAYAISSGRPPWRRHAHPDKEAHLSRDSMVDTRARLPGPLRKSIKLILPIQSRLFTKTMLLLGWL